MASAITLVLLALVVATSASAQDTAVSIFKSPSDPRSYEYFELENGLGALVISDPETDQAAASLDVNVGSGSNPPGREGLAHFLEHLLFLGTERYPEPGAYKDFISAHGGGDNAYTAFANTNYYFTIDADYLEGALDRFSQFFTAPLFNARYVERERQVVHSEYTANLRSDGRRLYDARRQAFNPAHPRSRFTVGTNQTLAGDGIRQELIDFYRSHYSAGLMKLVVLGREPTSELRRWVEERFSEVPDTGANRLSPLPPLYEPGRLPARMYVTPIKEHRALSFSFPIDPVAPHFRTKPTRLIADLLGHEGEGSLLAVLRQRGWATALSAGGGINTQDEATFAVDLNLTEQGQAHIVEIGELLFAQIRQIRDKGLEEWRYRELAAMAELNFQFAEKPDPGALVRGLASELHDSPPQEVLRGYSLMEGFEPELTRKYLDQLTPERVFMVLMAPGLPSQQRTQYYDTPYQLEAVPAEWLARWRQPPASPVVAALRLPPPNDFIPEPQALQLISDPSGAPASSGKDSVVNPVKIGEANGVTVWHATETGFGLPHSALFASFRTSLAHASLREVLLTRLYLALVNDQLNEFSYPADLAGMSYRLYPHRRGFSLRINGYSDREDKLLDKILTALADPRLDPERFGVLKADLERRYKNSLDTASYERASAKAAHLLLAPHWSAEQRLAALAPLEIEHVRAFVPRLLDDLRILVLGHGNLTTAKTGYLASLIEKRLGPDQGSEQEIPRPKVVRLQPGDDYVRSMQTTHNDDAIFVYTQLGEPEVDQRALGAMLVQLLEPHFYELMRTERKLGYVVFTYAYSLRRVPGMAFVIQSPSADAETLDRYVQGYYQEAAAWLDGLGEADIARNKKALVNRILKRENQLLDRTHRFWIELDREEYGFDSREKLAAAIDAIDLDRFRAFYREQLGAASRRTLTVLAEGTAKEAGTPPSVTAETPGRKGAERFTDDNVFRSRQSYFTH